MPKGTQRPRCRQSPPRAAPTRLVTLAVQKPRRDALAMGNAMFEASSAPAASSAPFDYPASTWCSSTLGFAHSRVKDHPCFSFRLSPAAPTLAAAACGRVPRSGSILIALIGRVPSDSSTRETDREVCVFIQYLSICTVLNVPADSATTLLFAPTHLQSWSPRRLSACNVDPFVTPHKLGQPARQRRSRFESAQRRHAVAV